MQDGGVEGKERRQERDGGTGGIEEREVVKKNK